MRESILTKDGIALRDQHRDYRRLMEVRAEEAENGDMIVRGTPVIFDKEYKLFSWGETDVYEIIDRHAFDEADYADVPLKYNHGDAKGTPARTTCKTEQGRLTISVLEDRVDMTANLLPTTGGKDLFLEVKSGAVAQMSWAFTEDFDAEDVIEEGADENGRKKVTFIVKKVTRVFDVSAVDFGANPETSIYARRRSDLDERAAKLDERNRQALRNRILIKTKI